MIDGVEPTSAVNPSEASVAALAERPDDDAIIMVNLLAFDPDDGREFYARYGAVAQGTVRDRGGSVAYSGPVIGGDPEDSFDIQRSGGDEVFVVSLMRFDDDEARTGWRPPGEVILRLQADVPMVSDCLWDELVVSRHSSLEAADGFGDELPPGFAAAMQMVTRPEG